VCGHPFVEYHHIDEFSEDPHHDPRRMMALCPNHHHQATVGALSRDAQVCYKSEPYNIARGFADGALKVNARAIAVEVGTNFFVGPGFKFLVDNESLLTLASDSGGRLSLSLTLYDEADQLQFIVDENEWVTGDPAPWDIQYGYNVLKIRRKLGDVTLDIDARALPVSVRGTLNRKQQTYSMSPSTLSVNGVVNDVAFSHLGLVAIQLAADTKAGTFTFGPYHPFRAGMIVSESDPAERLRKSLQAYQALARKARVGKNAPCICGSGRRFKACCGN
jgi:hypothetical protein